MFPRRVHVLKAGTFKIPGTHAGGVLPHDEIQRLAAVVTPVECVPSAGGVVAMRPLAVHASSKAGNDQPVVSCTSSMPQPFTLARTSSWPLANKHLQPGGARENEPPRLKCRR